MAELTERYVRATLRSIPENLRTDIEAELRVLIGDAVDARVDGGEDDGTAEEAVLTELGDPDRLAADYAGRPGHLIGPELFFDYKRLLGVLLVTVVPIVAVATGVGEAIGGADVADVIVGSVVAGLTLVVHIGFWVTLVFAAMERTEHRARTGDWSPSSLPPLTQTTGGVTLGDTIASLVFLVLALVGLVLSRDIVGLTAEDGSLVSFFDPATWDFWMPFLIAVLVLEIGFELVKYRVGRWTWSLASANLAINAAFAVPVIYLLATDQLFNPVFLEELGWTRSLEWSGIAATVTTISIVAIVAWDVIEGLRKARR